MHKTYQDHSRKNWGRDETVNIDRDEIQLGALLRIADAVEKMALRYDELMRERDGARSARDYWKKEHDSVLASNRAMRGVITKLKKAAKKVEDV